MDGFNGFAIFPELVFEEKLSVLFDESFDDRELVDLEFLILWGVRIIRSPLFKRNISANEANQPVILLIKQLHQLK